MPEKTNTASAKSSPRSASVVSRLAGSNVIDILLLYLQQPRDASYRIAFCKVPQKLNGPGILAVIG